MGHLQDAGLKALYVAYDGVQAIAKAESLQPDVILMDISLPRLNGIQAAAVIRECRSESENRVRERQHRSRSQTRCA